MNRFRRIKRMSKYGMASFLSAMTTCDSCIIQCEERLSFPSRASCASRWKQWLLAKDEIDEEKLRASTYQVRNKNRAELRADGINELVELMKPCNNCPSCHNECNDTYYFEDCCRTEQSISWAELRTKAEQLKKNHCVK